MASKRAIGIDLGTTNTCVGVYTDKTITIIPNSHGNLLTPSYVAFTNNGRLIGENAKIQAALNSENTVFDAKRLIGRKFDDPELQKDMLQWPFQVIDVSSAPKINVNVNGKLRAYFPEEISSMILGYMKKAAEEYLGESVQDCVITVPAYFNDSQRQATMDAGKIAGLNVMRIINEPTAAAIAYGLKKNRYEQNVLIYDLGGGTFDVSILRIVGTNIKVLATGGNTHLGGGDFDTNMMKYFINEFQEKNNFNLINDKRALRRLRTYCEKAKELLSTAGEAGIEIENLSNDKGFCSMMTRQKFEDLNIDLFNSTIKVVTKCLKDAKLDKSWIDEIIMVGGSTRIPKIQSLVRDYFDGKQLNKSINPDEAVACGAAIQASILQDEKLKITPEFIISDVIPISLGIQLSDGTMSNLIPTNTPIPCKKTRTYYPNTSASDRVDIFVYEGESTMANDNDLLGKFTLCGFSSTKVHDTKLNSIYKFTVGRFKAMKETDSKLEVTFEINQNSILTVTCLEIVSGLQKQIKINTDKGRLTEKDLKSIQMEEAQFCEEEAVQKISIKLKNKLINYCSEKKEMYCNNQSIIDKCDEIIEWTDNNPNAIGKEYLDKYVEVNKFCENQSPDCSKDLPPNYSENDNLVNK